jgi:hypothetical protein
MDSSGIELEPVVSFCECGSESSGTMKDRGIPWLTELVVGLQAGVFAVELLRFVIYVV